MTRYCECGRRIIVRINGKWKAPSDKQHDLCWRCWTEMYEQSIEREEKVA